MSGKECPRCRGPMEAGYVADKGHGDMLKRQEWIAGEPEKSIWHGLKTKGRERHPLRTFRCTRCGYLESYAKPE